VSNAWRHCRQRSASIQIEVSVAGDQMIELLVIDDGPGVSEEHAGKLFEPFFTTESRGTGLGLFIARELAEANRAMLDFVPLAERDRRADQTPGGSGAVFRLMMEGHV